MNDSSSSTTRIIAGSDAEKNSIRPGQWTLDQDLVAPTTCHVPLWATGLVTPFVTPALCHMPTEVASVRGREHLHRERMSSRIVSWTMQERQRCPDVQTKYPRVWANDHHWGTNHVILQGKDDFTLQLDKSSRKLPFCSGILQFWTTNHQPPESTFEYRGKARKERDRSRIIWLELKERKVCVNVDGDCQCHCLFW